MNIERFLKLASILILAHVFFFSFVISTYGLVQLSTHKTFQNFIHMKSCYTQNTV